MNNDILANAQEQSERRAAIRIHNKAAITAVLATHGVATVTIQFNGYGDEGQVDPASVFDAAGKEIAIPDVTVEILVNRFDSEPHPSSETLADAFATFVYNALDDLHGGWQDNEGGYGELTIDVATGKATLDFNEQYTASHNTTTEL